MGVQLRDIFERKNINLKELEGKIIFFDAFNMLYQFLATIRSRDGQLLTDSKGRVTSHLIGLFSRSTRFLETGIKPVYVFDGKVPELKEKTTEKRKEIKQEAKKKYEEAIEEGRTEEAKKYATRMMHLTPKMVEQAKELLEHLGIPIIQAPAEGEAQAAFMARRGEGWAVGSQDYDALVHGAPRLIQNLSVQEKKQPELIDLKQNLERLGITQDQLLAIAILVGTDYNPGGIKGIGPKTALKLVKEHGPEGAFKAAEWESKSDIDWHKIWNVFKMMPSETGYSLEWKPPNKEKVRKYLVKEHDFSDERVSKALEKVGSMQKGLQEYG